MTHAGRRRNTGATSEGFLQEHVKREKQIMAECDCPFMVNLVTSFKDTGHLYMLMECVMGGELFTYLQSRPGPLKEDHARFYTASVVLGLEYMQERNLLWRQVPQHLDPHLHCREASSRRKRSLLWRRAPQWVDTHLHCHRMTTLCRGWVQQCLSGSLDTVGEAMTLLEPHRHGS